MMRFWFVILALILLLPQCRKKESEISVPHLRENDYNMIDAVASKDGNFLLSILKTLDTVRLVKMRPDGSIQWAKDHDASEVYMHRKIAEGADGSIYLSATTAEMDSNGIYGNYNLIMKFSAGGVLLWKKRYGSSNKSLMGSMIALKSGDLAFISTYHEQTLPGVSQIVLNKMNPDGTLIWEQTLEAEEYEQQYGLLQAENGDLISVGYGTPSYRVHLIRFQDNGSLLWNKYLEKDSVKGNYMAYGATNCSDGGLMICGQYYNSKAGDNQALFMKVDASGKLIWKKEFGYFEQFESLRSVVQNNDGGFTATGISRGRTVGTVGGNKILALQTDGSGTPIYYRAFGKGASNEGIAIFNDAHNTYRIFGNSDGLNIDPRYFWTLINHKGEFQ